MGLLDFNIAEIASRLVRGAGVRGRVRPTLDDGVVSVAQVANFTRSPFRTDEQVYQGARQTGTAAAGETCNLILVNASPKPVIVEWWRAIPRTGAASRVVVGLDISPGLGLLASRAAFFSHEGMLVPSTFSPQLPSVWIRDMPVVGPFATNAAIDSFELGANGVGPANAALTADTDITVAPGMSLGFYSQTLVNLFGLSMRIRVVNNFNPS